jgi:hypothetical protein
VKMNAVWPSSTARKVHCSIGLGWAFVRRLLVDHLAVFRVCRRMY